MQGFEKKNLMIFLFIAVVLGLGLSTLFFFMASYSKQVLNWMALVVLAGLVFRSFWVKRKKVSGSLVKRFVYMVPGYFHLVNAVVLLLVFIPNAVRSGHPGFLLGLLASVLMASLYFVKIIMQKRVNSEK